MKKINYLLFLMLAITFSLNISAQDVRYMDKIFDGVNVESDVPYASNISVITGAPALETLTCDVYTPAGDTETERPVIIVLHSGSFLPQYINGQVTGGKLDSSVVNVCKELVARGYVAVAATYRAGWNPVATNQNVRTSTLLNAAYRGIQDTRACIRFLRKNIAEDGNTWGIDGDKIGVWGLGTGGYLSMGAGYLDRYEETQLPKFLDSESLQYYIDSSLSADPYGLSTRPLNIGNHVGYSSDFKIAVNMGGALGDISWVEGSDDEPALVGFHVVSDPFAPFGDGAVIVPTTGDFVVNVSGTRTAVAKVNEVGSNDILDPVNQLTNDLNTRVEAYKLIEADFPGGLSYSLAVDNMYPFLMDGVQSGPWAFWDKPTLDFVIPLVNAALGTELDSDVLHGSGLLTNPDMSREKALAYIDTTMRYFLPRACNALGLESCMTVAVKDVADQSLVNMNVSPNPASEFLNVTSNNETPILDIQLFDVTGTMINRFGKINQSNYRIDRNGLPAGIYFVKARFDDGYLTKKVIFK